MAEVFLALGSNLGDSRCLLSAAKVSLQQLSVLPLRASRLWASSPVDCPPGSPDFLNAMVMISPPAEMTPATLLSQTQQMEQALGRTAKRRHNEARVIDIDIIAFGDCTCSDANLLIPHPRAHLRRFVLGPFCDIAPDWVLAGQSCTVAQLLEQLPPEDGPARPLEEAW